MKDKILEIIKKTLDENKAEDITVIDLEGKTSIANYMVVATGTSNRHVASLAEFVRVALKKEKHNAILEGEDKADWVLIDAFDVICHIFRQEVREFYSIEKMWSAVKRQD